MKTPVRSRSGVPIHTIQDWEQHASTKGNWEPHFSAMELARLWLDGAGPQAVTEGLASVLPGLVLDEAIAEARVAFDAYAGGVRNHDVLAYGHVAAGGVVVGVEGKVNETLDATIARKYQDAARPRPPGKSTNLGKRVDALLLAIAGRSLQDDSTLGALRYQLFSAVAGTLAAARDGHGCGRRRGAPCPNAAGQESEGRGSACGGRRLRARAEPWTPTVRSSDR